MVIRHPIRVRDERFIDVGDAGEGVARARRGEKGFFRGASVDDGRV